MPSLANAAAALTNTGHGGGSGGSKYFPQGSPRVFSRTRFHVGLVKFECKDANVMTGGKPNTTAHARQILALMQRADETAVFLPIDMEDATPISRIEKSEAIKDGDDMSRCMTDVTTGRVRGAQGASGVRFSMRMRLTKSVKTIKWDEKVTPTLRKMGIWMEARTTKSTEPCRI